MLRRLPRLLRPKSRVRVSLFSSHSELETLILSQYNSQRRKFLDLLSSAVSSPSFLLSAALNLSYDAVEDPNPISTRIRAISLSLRSGQFSVESNCVVLQPSRTKGETLTLPNLDLKVVIESLRIALEIVYDKRFVTFAYGGRNGLGRHTAVRYLKSAVKNPNWWFRVVFKRQPFDLRHVSRLAKVIEEKIDDQDMIGLVERLFVTKAVVVEIGGVCNGRGLPQESKLGAILMNVYFDRLDREIEEIREEVHKKNPRMDDSRVLHKPVRVYAVRYLDEILVVTSGNKLLTMDIKDRIMKFVENELELKVDKLASSIHSATVEKMDFMGFELQAVTPSVLHPPMSEKAMRAKKMYLKRKAARALEMKNARETVRKKLGMKIWSHVFRKLKKCGGFKFDFRIESQVREVFRKWGEECVAEFFSLRDECRDFHRVMTSGDFLSLKRIRDQLPDELVESYDQFQEKVDKYMMPMKASKVFDEDINSEDEEEEEEKEEKDYAKRTVEDLTELRMRVNAPLELIRKCVKLARFTNAMGRPRPIKILLCLDDADIIKWYAGVGKRWLDFFCCCRNFRTVKKVIDYHLRFSCILTFAEKHESTKREAIQHFTKDLKVVIKEEDGSSEAYFPTEREIRMMGDEELSDPLPVDGSLSLILVRLATNESCPCLAHFCDKKDTVIYRVRLLQNRMNVDPLDAKKWVEGMGFVHEALNLKCLPLCSKHSTELLMGRMSLNDIDCTSFLDVD